MSRLDTKVQEENRQAYIRDQKLKLHREAVTDWLKNNPSIGALHGNKYYIVKDYEVIYINELQEI